MPNFVEIGHTVAEIPQLFYPCIHYWHCGLVVNCYHYAYFVQSVNYVSCCFLKFNSVRIPFIDSWGIYKMQFIVCHLCNSLCLCGVYCSDGSGRTGTYCLIDLVLNRIVNGKPFNVGLITHSRHGMSTGVHCNYYIPLCNVFTLSFCDWSSAVSWLYHVT